MKRFLLLAVAALAFVGCNNAFEDEQASRLALSELPTLTAGFEDADTRTYVEDNFYLRWHEGDLISAFIGDTRNCKYQFEGKTGDNSGTFVSVESSLGSSEKLDRIYALYPYDKSATITTKGVISCSLSAIQTYATDSFAQNVNTMVSATSGVNDGDIIFKNVGGYLKIRLYGEGAVKSIELRGNNGEKIAGIANITATYGGVPKIAMADDATESIMLDCGDGVELSADAENPTEFWVVVPPTEFSKGINISVTSAYDAVFEKSTSNKIVVERNMIQPMAAIEVEFDVYDPTKPAKNEIWYTSTDGEIVKPYTSNVFGATIVSNTYEDGKGVITFDGAVTTIGGYAFQKCFSLTSVTIPDSVTTIGEWAFYNCYSLTSVTIPDSVTKIGYEAFMSCFSLTSVTIPDSVTTLGGGAFVCCPLIKEFKGKFAEDNGRCLIVDNTLIAYANKSGTEYTIPDSVTTIGDWAFSECDSLTSVTIPDSVTTIGEWTFNRCDSLTSVIIGDSVTTIGYKAFRYCSSLTSITIPDSVTTIGYRAFAYCDSLTSVTIGDSVTTIGDDAFYSCNSLTSVTIGDSVTTIGNSAFIGCRSLTSVTIPDSVTTIGDKAFYGCAGLKEVYCKPTTPPTMGVSVFANAPLEAIYVLTASVNDYKTAYGWCDYADYIIGYDFDKGEIATPKPANNEIWYTATEKVEPYFDYEFGATLLSNIYNPTTKEGVLTFDSDVTQIGYKAFYECEKLTSVTIPDSVTTIGESAFDGCDSLTSVTIGDSVTTIGDDAFDDCNSLTSVTIPDSVTTIGEWAFASCVSLTSVTIGDSVTTIGVGAFDDCYSLTSVTIPDSVTTIGNMAFGSCYSLTSVIIGDSVTTIGDSAFSGCDSLTSITIPDSVTTIGAGAFAFCDSLKEFKGKYATDNGRCLIKYNTIIAYAEASGTEYTIPDSVTTIGEDAFIYCKSLTSVTIPDSVTTIGRAAFFDCSSLTSVYCKATTPPRIGINGLEYNANSRKIYVPTASVNDYKTAYDWCDYADYIVGYDF